MKSLEERILTETTIKNALRLENQQLCAALESLINAVAKEFGEVEQYYLGGDIRKALDAARNILDAKTRN